MNKKATRRERLHLSTVGDRLCRGVGVALCVIGIGPAVYGGYEYASGSGDQYGYQSTCDASYRDSVTYNPTDPICQYPDTSSDRIAFGAEFAVDGLELLGIGGIMIGWAYARKHHRSSDNAATVQAELNSLRIIGNKLEVGGKLLGKAPLGYDN